MKAITRIRIILFALMVFGAFANFALNEWGNTLIVLCEVLMALSFIVDIVITLVERVKVKNKTKVSYTQLGLIGVMFLSVILIIVSVFLFKSTPEIIPIILLIAFLGLSLNLGTRDNHRNLNPFLKSSFYCKNALHFFGSCSHVF